MILTYIGSGDPRFKQTFSFPGGKIVRGASIEVKTAPTWLANAHPGTFLVDGKPYTAPKLPKPAAKPVNPANKEKHG